MKAKKDAPVNLAQVNSSELEEEKAKINLKSLIETQKIIQHINSVGKSNKVTQLA